MRLRGVIALSSTDGSPRRRPHPAPLTVAEFARLRGLELLRFAYLLCGDRHRAEDLLQDVLLAMYRHFGAELPLDNPVGYARRSLANANVSWSRRSANRELVIAELPDAATLDENSDTRDALWQALRRLPVRQRTVVVLRFYADADDTEIATTLGCRRGTVRSLASRALATLRADAALDLEGGAR
jgi:RNA polymerase sigma-70 factor (sigma-E family)